ncbi:MAG TPA: energy-coupling factor ABC transporter permease [Acidimicrobiales bacterium]
MHVPDGFIDAPVCAAGAVVAAGTVALAARKAAHDLDDRAVPLAGLTSAYVFAVQMLNFPVASGTSGHLLGGCLAAAFVGPWLACVAMAVVVGVQALVFADGGLSALGINVILLAVVPAFAGAAILRVASAVLPATRRALLASTAVAAWVTVVLAAAVFTALFALGGAADVALRDLAVAMIGVHALVGVGEAAITTMTLGAVLASRPDLVHAARHLTAAHAVARTAGTPA